VLREEIQQGLLAGRYRKVMVMGAPDTGKTHLVFSLAGYLAAQGLRVGVLDFDPGQSSIGPPCTVGMQYPFEEGRDLLHPTAMVFLGRLSPAGDVGAVIDAGLRLERRALELGCGLLLMDTSGMIEGGLAALLKRGKIYKLRPDLVISLDEKGETGHIFNGLEESACGRIEFVKPSPHARSRGRRERFLHRSELFREYFRDAGELWLDLSKIDLIPVSNCVPADPEFLSEGHLLGLDDAGGFALALAALVDRDDGVLVLRSPFKGGTDRIKRLSVGALRLDAGFGTSPVEPRSGIQGNRGGSMG